MTDAIIIQDGPLDCASPGIPGDAIETFDAGPGLLGWSDKVIEIVGDTGSSTTIHQDIIRVRVNAGAVGGVRGSIVTMPMDTGNPHGDSCIELLCDEQQAPERSKSIPGEGPG
jgi:hypothetical protein